MTDDVQISGSSINGEEEEEEEENSESDEDEEGDRDDGEIEEDDVDTRDPIQLKQFWLEKPLEFLLEIPYTEKNLRNGCSGLNHKKMECQVD